MLEYKNIISPSHYFFHSRLASPVVTYLFYLSRNSFECFEYVLFLTLISLVNPDHVA
jgi:hypothetical protein